MGIGKRVLTHKTEGQGGVVVAILLVIAAVVLGYWIFLRGWHTVEPGYVGVVFDKKQHKVINVAEPGWIQIDPWNQAIMTYQTTDRVYAMVRPDGEGQVQGDDSVIVQDREGQKFSVEIAVQFAVQRDKVAEFYQKFGGVPIEAIETGVVRNNARSALTAIAPKYRWDEFNQKRAEIAADIEKELSASFAENYLVLKDYDIRELNLPKNLEEALAAKIQKQQQAEQQRYELEQARIKADQDKVVALGQAEAAKAQAAGEAEATLTRAKAQAEANRLLAQSLTPELVRYREIDKWDGKQPQVVGGAGGSMLYNVNPQQPAAAAAPAQ